MSDNIVLSVKNIAFSINQNRLFHNLSFDLEQGKALHIKGNNGSGKSSLLRIILGITFVLKGEILWLKDLNKIFLGHKNVLKNHLTVADNLYLHGIDILNTNVKSTLEELGLYEKIDLLVGNLSYGQQKKLALVRVLLNNSSVIILDEPCVGLDDEARVLISKFLNSELKKNKINPDCIQLINKTNRDYVDYLLSNMRSYIDVIVPRGGKSLVKKVLDLSKVPVIGHLEGLCHIYVDSKASLEMSRKVVFNAKLRRTSICGAVETLLIHKKVVGTHLLPILNLLHKNGCKIIGDKMVKKHFAKASLAKEMDWKTEYLDSIISVKVVDNMDEAISHIHKYGTNHTESIITNSKQNAQKFLNEVTSSIVMHNTSTQFADCLLYTSDAADE